jgi:hypothetical protein
MLISIVASGDRTHIPDNLRPTYSIINEHLHDLRRRTHVGLYILVEIMDMD